MPHVSHGCQRHCHCTLILLPQWHCVEASDVCCLALLLPWLPWLAMLILTVAISVTVTISINAGWSRSMTTSVAKTFLTLWSKFCWSLNMFAIKVDRILVKRLEDRVRNTPSPKYQVLPVVGLNHIFFLRQDSVSFYTFFVRAGQDDLQKWK